MVGLTVGDLEGVRVGSFVRFDSVGDTVGNKDGGNAVAIAKDGREELGGIWGGFFMFPPK